MQPLKRLHPACVTAGFLSIRRRQFSSTSITAAHVNKMIPNRTPHDHAGFLERLSGKDLRPPLQPGGKQVS